MNGYNLKVQQQKCKINWDEFKAAAIIMLCWDDRVEKNLKAYEV